MKFHPSARHKALLAALGLALAGYFWYTRPMTLEQLCPSFRWAETSHISGDEMVGGAYADPPVIVADTLPIDDPEAQAIYRRCMETKFRRDPMTALGNLMSGWVTYTYGEAGSIPSLFFFASDPNQRIDLMVTEYKTATLSSADIDMPLRCTDETLFRDLLDYLRAHPYDPDAQPSVPL